MEKGKKKIVGEIEEANIDLFVLEEVLRKHGYKIVKIDKDDS